ncbi:hypothetical protein B0H11DRAFT_1907344 [Mycena galericulata]|nr:hypothetical protein B0H11DRAFT_1907344 [Mycena galericulata]
MFEVERKGGLVCHFLRVTIRSLVHPISFALAVAPEAVPVVIFASWPTLESATAMSVGAGSVNRLRRREAKSMSTAYAGAKRRHVLYSFKDLGVIAERHVELQKPSDGLEVQAKTPKALN